MLLYHFFRLILISLSKIFLWLEVSGRTNIPKKGGFILASNHLSNLDPMILGVACYRELNFMAKEDLFRNGFFGRLISTVGAFPVKRDYGDVSAFKEAISRLKRGCALVIFPEGTRNQNTKNVQAQPGIGLLSSKANCPILPVFISGTDKAMPPGFRFIRPAKVKVKFGRLLCFESSQPYELIASKVMQEIISLKIE